MALLAGQEEAGGGARLAAEMDSTHPEFGTLRLAGLPAAVTAALLREPLTSDEWREVLTLRVAEPGDPDLPPVLGDYELETDGVRFRPRFPLAPGLAFRAELDGPGLAVALGLEPGAVGSRVLEVTLPAPTRTPAPRVTAIYPSTAVVPENLLRIYVHFSTPMRTHRVGGLVRLLNDASGEEVTLPFVDVPDGLWDPTGQRLTLFFHPGRIKRGVGPNQALGPPLRSGQGYRLVVDGAIRDAGGRALGEPFEHRFRAEAADRSQPQPTEWSLEPPADPTGMLLLRFPEPLDHGLLHRLVWVEGPAGEPIDGVASVGEGERSWSFAPAAPWTAGEHRVLVHPGLEDLAGNTPAGLFDVELPAGPELDPDDALQLPWALPFRVEAP